MRSVDIADPQFDHDAGDPDGFRCGKFRFGAQLGAEASGATVYELPPGQAVCPYHYEYGEEEWVLVLAGRVAVRTPEGVEQLAPSQMAFFPRGPEGAHQIRNDATEPARVLMWSTVVRPTASGYPDSGKVAIKSGDRAQDGVFRRADAVDYYDGESGNAGGAGRARSAPPPASP
ncbi:MAG: Cupin 2 conserved barrel domain protein [Conexibacter sp.]|nr:Cupin 2 conserved barrel domain protein [Conexibacter sp.]